MESSENILAPRPPYSIRPRSVELAIQIALAAAPSQDVQNNLLAMLDLIRKNSLSEVKLVQHICRTISNGLQYGRWPEPDGAIILEMPSKITPAVSVDNQDVRLYVHPDDLRHVADLMDAGEEDVTMSPAGVHDIVTGSRVEISFTRKDDNNCMECNTSLPEGRLYCKGECDDLYDPDDDFDDPDSDD